VFPFDSDCGTLSCLELEVLETHDHLLSGVDLQTDVTIQSDMALLVDLVVQDSRSV
jgi:hypothetical protein